MGPSSTQSLSSPNHEGGASLGSGGFGGSRGALAGGGPTRAARHPPLGARATTVHPSQSPGTMTDPGWKFHAVALERAQAGTTTLHQTSLQDTEEKKTAQPGRAVSAELRTGQPLHVLNGRLGSRAASAPLPPSPRSPFTFPPIFFLVPWQTSGLMMAQGQGSSGDDDAIGVPPAGPVAPAARSWVPWWALAGWTKPSQARQSVIPGHSRAPSRPRGPVVGSSVLHGTRLEGAHGAEFDPWSMRPHTPPPPARQRQQHHIACKPKVGGRMCPAHSPAHHAPDAMARSARSQTSALGLASAAPLAPPRAPACQGG